MFFRVGGWRLISAVYMFVKIAMDCCCCLFSSLFDHEEFITCSQQLCCPFYYWIILLASFILLMRTIYLMKRNYFCMGSSKTNFYATASKINFLMHIHYINTYTHVINTWKVITYYFNFTCVNVFILFVLSVSFYILNFWFLAIY